MTLDGGEAEGQTGNYYYRHRYYHSKQGRFMSNDPIGYGDGLNMYAYAGNDPVNRYDPMGLARCITNPTPDGSRTACWPDGSSSGGGGLGWSFDDLFMSDAEGTCDRDPSNPLCGNDGPAGGSGGVAIDEMLENNRKEFDKTTELRQICGGNLSWEYSSVDHAALAVHNRIMGVDSLTPGLDRSNGREYAAAFLRTDDGGVIIGSNNGRGILAESGRNRAGGTIGMPVGNAGGLHSHPTGGNIECQQVPNEYMSSPGSGRCRDFGGLDVINIPRHPAYQPGVSFFLTTPAGVLRRWNTGIHDIESHGVEVAQPDCSGFIS